jgi:hypothetical protein
MGLMPRRERASDLLLLAGVSFGSECSGIQAKVKFNGSHPVVFSLIEVYIYIFFILFLQPVVGL